MPWLDRPAFAATSNTMRVGVTPTSQAPPDRVADLLASPNLAIEGQISLTWTAPQGNAGGVPINNQAVDHYIVRYATFSIDSLIGDTTTWWNSEACSFWRRASTFSVTSTLTRRMPRT